MDHECGAVRLSGEDRQIKTLDGNANLPRNQPDKIGELRLVDSMVSAPALDDTDERRRTADQHHTLSRDTPMNGDRGGACPERVSHDPCQRPNLAPNLDKRQA